MKIRDLIGKLLFWLFIGGAVILVIVTMVDDFKGLTYGQIFIKNLLWYVILGIVGTLCFFSQGGSE